MTKKLTYLDSGVLIAAFNGQKPAHEEAFAIIDDPDREFVATDYQKFEILPKTIYFKNEEEEAFYNFFFENATQHVAATQENFNEGFKLACQYGLGPVDSLHVHSAIATSASEFYTLERPTTAFFRIDHAPLKFISLNKK